MDNDRLKVLELISNGTISAEEGMTLLDALEPVVEEEASLVNATMEPLPTGKPTWAEYWPYLLGIGGAIAGSGLMTTLFIFAGRIHWGWSIITIPMFSLGFILAVFAWLMHTSAWIHIRVKDDDTNINIRLPLPLHWVARIIWFIRPFIPELREKITDDILELLATSLVDEGFHIEVQEDDGERVLVSYG